VLVIDDEPDARVLLREMLEEFDVRVLEAGDGEEGLRLAHEHEPDLITLDLRMPDVDGWEVVRRLQADSEASDIPIVVVSIAGRASQRTFSGPIDFLDKPALREDVIELVARRIDQRRSYVLVVDDDADARELFRLMAESHGARVRTADSGRAALQELDRKTPSLVILDIGMDNIDGIELLSMMRRDPRFETLPVVVVTGRDLTRGEQEALRGNVISVLRKNGEMDIRLQQILRASLL
jgi:CheY-like chemotaxis protein